MALIVFFLAHCANPRFSSNLLAESIYSFVVREAVLLPWSFINVSLQFVRFCHGLKNISTYDCDIFSQIAAVIALWFSQVKLTRNSGNMTYVVVAWRGGGGGLRDGPLVKIKKDFGELGQYMFCSA